MNDKVIRYYDKEKLTRQQMEDEVEKEFPNFIKITWFDAFEWMEAAIELPQTGRK